MFWMMGNLLRSGNLARVWLTRVWLGIVVFPFGEHIFACYDRNGCDGVIWNKEFNRGAKKPFAALISAYLVVISSVMQTEYLK